MPRAHTRGHRGPGRAAGCAGICGSVLCWSELPGVLSTWRRDGRGEGWARCAKAQRDEPVPRAVLSPQRGWGWESGSQESLGYPILLPQCLSGRHDNREGADGGGSIFVRLWNESFGKQLHVEVTEPLGSWKPQSSETTARFLFVFVLFFAVELTSAAGGIGRITNRIPTAHMRPTCGWISCPRPGGPGVPLPSAITVYFLWCCLGLCCINLSRPHPRWEGCYSPLKGLSCGARRKLLLWTCFKGEFSCSVFPTQTLGGSFTLLGIKIIARKTHKIFQPVVFLLFRLLVHWNFLETE